MRNLLLLLFFSFSQLASAQVTFSPSLSTTEFCPERDYTISMTVPKDSPDIDPSPSVSVGLGISFSSPVLVQNNASNNVYEFTIRLADENGTRDLRVLYTPSETSTGLETNAQILRVLSLKDSFEPFAYFSFTAPLCEEVSEEISFTNVMFENFDDLNVPLFGEVMTYKYFAPLGWSVDGVISDGTTGICGNNSVTITSPTNGINQDELSLVVSPNPMGAKGRIVFEVPRLDNIDMESEPRYEMEIFNFTGQKVFESSDAVEEFNELRIPGDLTPGTYFVRMVIEGLGQPITLTKRFIRL